MIGSGTSNFSQSISQAPDDTNGVVAASNANRRDAPVAASEQLSIKTASGIDVKILLTSEDGQLAVKIKSSGELTDAERGALGKLADAFQKALDGLSAVPPKLDLGELTQFDPTILSSIDLHSTITLQDKTSQTVDFHADSTKRTLALDGPSGKVDVNVDMRNAAIRGNQQQKNAAIDSYLKQFDQAGSRGNADKSLMSLFKDAFTQMNSDYPASPPLQLFNAPLAESDHAMLSGLADFNASITQNPQAPNPRHLDELDTFSYQTSQNTTVTGLGRPDRAISQQQQSQLSSSYHLSLIPDVPLQLTTLNKSQNYYYKQIDDTASSTTTIEYEKGRLSTARSEQSASQSTRVRKYEMGELTEDTTMPSNASLTLDILATLKPFLQNERARLPLDTYRWQQTLDDVHNKILLQNDPGDVGSRR